jgi:BlaI family transcriptional regulator, penicillinase repressor
MNIVVKNGARRRAPARSDRASGPAAALENEMPGKERRAKRELPELSRLELEVMDVVWNLGDCSSAQVIEAYASRRDLAKTTLRTVLANLRRKGYLAVVPSVERGYRLRPIVARATVARRSLPTLIRHLFAGSPRQAIAWLLQAEAIDEKDLDEIRALIDARRGRKGR